MKTLLTFRKNENFYERCHSFRKISSIFRKNFSRKPQSDKKWYKISVEKDYMEPEPWFFGLLDPDPVRILVLFEEKGNSMLKIIKQSKHLQRKVQYCGDSNARNK
jgi:hypothetical protein